MSIYYLHVQENLKLISYFRRKNFKILLFEMAYCIEIRKKERERKQQDVNKLLTAVVDLENAKQNNQTQQQIQSNKQKNLNENRFSTANSSQQQQQQMLNQSAPTLTLAAGLNSILFKSYRSSYLVETIFNRVVV